MSKTTGTRMLRSTDDFGNVTLTLNRPEVHNAFDPGMVCELTEALESIHGDDSIRAVIIAGAGKS